MDPAKSPRGPSEEFPDRTPEGGPRREAPGYDPTQEGYVGISAGTLGSLGDALAARDLAEMVVDTVREGLLVLDLDLRVRAANGSFYEAFRVKPEETVGRLVYDLGNGQWDLLELRKLLEDILPHERAFDGYEVEHDFVGVGPRVVLLNARRLDNHSLILLAVEDVTERRRRDRELRDAHVALKAQTQEVRRLALALTLAEQEERQRIAYVLHEDLQQVLAAASMATASDDPTRLQALLGDAMALTRTLAHELSPPLLEGDGVEDLLLWAAHQARERHGLDVEVEVRDGASVPEPALRVLLYQFLSELLFNVAKHAGKGRVRLGAEGVDGDVRVVVEDEGTGFDPAALNRSDGLGLPGVRERLELVGGRLEIESAPGEGTRVTITVPVGEASAEGVSSTAQK
jgi:signal transduction histidine kinase